MYVAAASQDALQCLFVSVRDDRNDCSWTMTKRLLCRVIPAFSNCRFVCWTVTLYVFIPFILMVCRHGCQLWFPPLHWIRVLLDLRRKTQDDGQEENAASRADGLG